MLFTLYNYYGIIEYERRAMYNEKLIYQTKHCRKFGYVLS